MDETIIVNKLKDFNYNSVFYCSNDQNYRIENSRFFSNANFKDLLKDIKDNYLLFAIEMYVVDHCDISVRTFNDSSPFYDTENKQNKNYSIGNYSMYGSNTSFVKNSKAIG